MIMLMLLLTGTIFGEGFEKNYTSQYSCRAGPVFEISDDSYIIVVNRFTCDEFWEEHPVDIALYKVSLNGEFEDSLLITYGDSALTKCFTGEIIDGKMTLFATAVDTLSGGGDGVIICITSDLSIEWIRRITTPGTYSCIESLNVESDSVFCIAGQFKTNSPADDGIFIQRISITGVTTNSQTIPGVIQRVSLLFVLQSNEYQLIATSKIFKLNYELDTVSLIWTKSITNPILFTTEAVMVSDSTFIQTGNIITQYTTGIIFDNALIERKIDSTILNYYVFGAIDTNDETYTHCLLYNSPDSMLFMSQSNSGPHELIMTDPADVWLSLYNINNEGQINWYRRYGLHGCFQFPRAIRTSDFGYLILCEKYDWQQLYPKYFSTVYLLKVDAHGDVSPVGMNEQSIPYVPVSVKKLGKELIITTAFQSASTVILDVTGREILKVDLKEGRNCINVSDFSKGTYILRVIAKDSIQYCLKFICAGH